MGWLHEEFERWLRARGIDPLSLDAVELQELGDEYEREMQDEYDAG